ncbi:presenilin family intramembrane aspartyl protease PSH [Haloprofundus salilacus]|uniref:presenilin family intramembrane aspartyl protease PSH n=1 Tax=Haloprofundus salilacus TaxID=2876190 RepID=UPI001CCF40F3|nr:presenilin family intramembrane aspartyl protease PSH [Haloprofundus salilacus]
MNPRTLRGTAFAALVFLLVQLGALALVPTFDAAGYQAVENPSDPTNSFVYIGAILVATAGMLLAFRYDAAWTVRALVLFSSGLLSWYVFSAVVPPTLVVQTGAGYLDLLTLGLAAGVSLALYFYPEWYVVDTAGVLMGAGAAGLFGISFGVLPAIVLLAVLAVYDAISVYGTEHMLSLAEGVMDLRVPVVLVIPLSLSYSLLDDDFSGASDVHEGDEERENESENSEGRENENSVEKSAVADGDGVKKPEENETDAGRDAFFIGLGDAVMPTVLVASAAFFSPAATLGFGAIPALNLPALAAMVGTFLGLGVLMWAVAKGRAHAGLPLLNGGAIGGYLVGSLLAGVSLVQALGIAPYL